MNNFYSIVGNERVKNSLINLIKDNKHAHAYLFISDDEIIRREMALAFAKALQCEHFHDDDSCNECKSCMTFDSGNNVDVRYIDKDIKGAETCPHSLPVNGVGEAPQKMKNNIGVDNIRENVVKEIMFAPVDNKYKIFIIDHAETMNVNAQNALLKTLEEPNEYVKLILLTSSKDAILSTILSRCVAINLNPLNEKEINKWALTYLNPQNYEDFDFTLKLYSKFCCGNVSRLKRMMDEDDSFTELKDVVNKIAGLLFDNKYESYMTAKNYLLGAQSQIEDVLFILEV